MLSLATTALSRLRARRGRVLLSALGVVAAALVVGTATTVAYSLATGFERTAQQADLPHVLARFDSERQRTVDERVRALPNLAAREYRLEVNDVGLRTRGRSTGRGAVHVVLEGTGQEWSPMRRGYAVTEGRDLAGGPGEVVVEQGLADEWSLAPGDSLRVGPFGRLRIVGTAVAPDNVAFPLARAARVYISEREVRRRFGPGETPANVALLWLQDGDRTDITLTQARVVTFSIGGLRFLTRDGVRVQIDQAGGVVIALLVAFSTVALVAAGTMLAAGAHADVQRRLPALGVQRAIGFSPGQLVAGQAMEALLISLPAAALGLALGALAVAGPTADLLAALNQVPPGTALLGPLAGCLTATVALFTAAAVWPVWSAARRSPTSLLRGGDLDGSARRWSGRRGAGLPAGGLVGLGGRFALAARGRWLAAVATVGVCAGVVMLMVSLAGLLERLRDDPATVGKRYQLTAALDPSRLAEVRAIPGVQAATARYAIPVAHSFRLGESLTLVAFPGDHTRFEAPPLSEGRRVRAADEAEVGAGLASVLGLRPGSTLAVQAPSGSELRFRVVGIVRALDNDGRLAYIRPDRLLAAEDIAPTLAIRLEPAADRRAVEAGLRSLGAPARTVGGASSRDAAFLGVLAAVLRGVGLAVGLVCLYALVQAVTMTARERRPAIAVLRSGGAGRRTVGLVLAGASLVVAVPAAVLGVLLEMTVLGPAVSAMAADYASVPLTATPGQVAVVVLGLLLFSAAATALVARAAMRSPIVSGLRRE